MAISSLGTGSGLDLQGIISGLVGAERAPTEQRLAIREQTLTAELSAFGAFKSSLNVFKGSISGLLSTSTFSSKSVSVSDGEVFTASAESFADPGNYNIEVTAVAQAQSLATSAASAFDSVSDTIGTGTLTVNFGTTTTDPAYGFVQDTSKATETITVSAANNNTTLSGFRDYINNGDFGFKATIVNDGSGYRLLLTSENTGAANSLEITVTNDGDLDNTDNGGLSQLAFNALAQTSLTQTVEAKDAALTINGLAITRDTNTVTGAINGVTLNLLQEQAGSSVSLRISENTSKAASAVGDFVESYNGLITNINALTSYNAETREAGILNGDASVRGITSSLKTVVTGGVSGLDGSIRSLADLGITSNSIDGTLSLNQSVLNQALADKPDEVEALFAKLGTPTDSDINYVTASEDTQVGNYLVNVSTLATQALFSGTTVNTLTIGSTNDNFVIEVDGFGPASITLAQATYASGDDLAAQIQAQINDNQTLKDAGASVVVSYDSGGNTFDITSNRFGSESNIEFLSVDTTTSNDIGFSVGGGTSGVDVAGTINGQAATGSGQTLTSTAGDSSGLALQILAGSTGDRGAVAFTRGVADTLDRLIDSFLNNDGVIAAREEGINERLDDIAIERERLEIRISSLEARLVKQFTALDTLIAQFFSCAAAC